MVCLSVCLSVCHTSEPCKNGWTDRDVVWVEDSGGPMELCIRSWKSRSPHGKGQFWGGKGRLVVKYRDTLRSSVQKRPNRSTLCLKKVPTFKLSVTLSNLNPFQSFCTAAKHMKFATKPIRYYPSNLKRVATLPWKIKKFKFSADIQHIWKKMQTNCILSALMNTVSRDISRTILWVCGLSSWLKTKSLTVSTFLPRELC